MVRLRRYVVAGLLVWAPVGATILVFRLLLGLMERLLFWLPAQYRPEALFEFNLPALNAIVSGVLAFAVLVATGMLAANLIGKRLVNLYESWLARIPLVRTVYGSVKHFVEVVLSDTSESFKRVLLIEYPRKGVYSMAFQTSDQVGEVQARTGEVVLTVFLPTTPNPTSGFILFVPRNEVVELDMSIEEALKMIVSLGVVVPRWHPVHPEDVEKIGGEPGEPAFGEPTPSLAEPRAPALDGSTAPSFAEPTATSLPEPSASKLAPPPVPADEPAPDAVAAREREDAQPGLRVPEVAQPKAAP